MGRKHVPMNARIENFIRMEARGEPYKVILKEIFGLNPGDPGDHAAQCTMSRWRHREDAQAIWDDEMKARVRRCVPRAVGRLELQIDDDNGWIANKAANDVVNLAKTTGIFQSEEKAVSVRFEGMPDIGSPDQEEGE